MGGRLGRAVGVVLAAMMIVATLPLAANGLINTVSGQIVKINPPANASEGALQSPLNIFAWNEQQGTTLASALRVDITSPGTYDQATDLGNLTVAAGTRVDSHILHSDKPTSTGTTLREGTVTFPTQILGVIVSTGKLNDSDILGSTGTIYPGSGSQRGLEFGGNGDLVVLPDLRTLQVSLNTVNNVDEVRVVTRHNSPPVISARGPYAGTEGAPVTLSGTATDSDNDTLTRNWTFTWTGKPGTSCSATGTTTLTPALTCTDDALVTATLTVSDGVNTPVVSTTQVTVGNSPPVIGSFAGPTAPVALSSPVSVSGAFSDPGTNDTHSATVTWGDTTSSSASITETNGAGTLSASHTYAMRGIYTVSVTLTDDDNGTATRTTQVQVNGPPTADAAGPYTGTEGTAAGLVGTAVDPENDALTTTWSLTPTLSDPGTVCTSVGTNTLAPTVTCNDDAVVTAQLSASDSINPPSLSSTTVTIANVPPALGAFSVPAGPLAVGSPLNVSAPFTDAGTNDSHTATVAWGDVSSSNATVLESQGSGSVAATHAYAQPGIYTVTITLKDDNGGIDTATAQVTVNSPPTASTGGPYVGSEGAQLSLAGTANDPDHDPLSTTWAFTSTGDPGLVCTATGTTTLSPSLVCNDDAVVTATLTVSDGVNAPIHDTTTVTVGNLAPVGGALVPSASLIANGATLSVSQSFSDAGTNDTHTMTIDWGDGSTPSSGVVTEHLGSGTATGNHVYVDSGGFTVTTTITDDNGDTTVTTAQIVVNGPPVVSAGGPYTGTEGSPVALNGSAHDPEGDPLVKSWAITWTGDAGTGCVLTGATTLTPAVTCTDDATVTATLTVNDGVNDPVTDTAVVHVTNAAPVVTSVTLPGGQVPTSTPVSVSAPFTDVGTNDTHTATIDWGDSTTSAGAVTESNGSGTVAGSHAYATHGSYTVTVTVTDDDGGHDAATGSVSVNGSPTVGAGGPYAGAEGSGITLSGTAVDPDSDTLAVSWTRTVTSADPGTTCTFTNTTTLTPTLSCNDDAVVRVTANVSDGVNGSVTDSANVTVHNVGPTVNTPTLTPSSVASGAPVSLSATFNDPGTNDSHTATINWGDTTTSAGTVTESNGSGSVTGSHVYGVAGTYTVTVTVTDDNGGSDTSSTTIVVNGAPTVNAGGPYSGVEGAGVTLSGTASDPDGDALAVSWTQSIVSGGPGTVCSLANPHSLTPTLTCNDNATVKTTLSVSDGLHAPVIDTAMVTIANVAPSATTPVVTPNPVRTGGLVSLSLTFSDPGTNDTHVATINWGDTTTSNGGLSEAGGNGSVTGSHTFANAGTYTVVVTLNDNDGGVTQVSTVVTVDPRPTANAGGPYSGTEGSPVGLTGTVNDANHDPLATSWTLTWSGDPGTSCTISSATTLTPSVTCNDDASVTATLSVSDGVNAPITSSAHIQITNVAPSVGAVVLPTSPTPIGTPLSIQTTLSDQGSHDTHTATIAWGDATTSAGTVTESNGAGSVTGSHVYSVAGTYTVSVTVKDDNGGTTTRSSTAYVVVYDPGAGFVTGGGWISSLSGAFPSNSSAIGDANFGFVSKYLPHDTTPSGNTEFQLKSASVNLHATGMAWLVVTNNDTKAYYAGTGTVNGVAGYSFLVSVIDGGKNADTFRMKVWQTASGTVLYDNQSGAPDDATAVQTIANGSIVIHG